MLLLRSSLIPHALLSLTPWSARPLSICTTAVWPLMDAYVSSHTHCTYFIPLPSFLFPFLFLQPHSLFADPRSFLSISSCPVFVGRYSPCTDRHTPFLARSSLSHIAISIGYDMPTIPNLKIITSPTSWSYSVDYTPT
ncbi:hypothetical protein C8R47DRAFT_1163263, partial [Mycena vitilis]